MCTILYINNIIIFNRIYTFTNIGLIAGSAGVIALPMAKIVSTVGLPYMSLAVMLSSILQLLMGIFKFSKVILIYIYYIKLLDNNELLFII